LSPQLQVHFYILLAIEIRLFRHFLRRRQQAFPFVLPHIKPIDAGAKIIVASGFIDPRIKSTLMKSGVVHFILNLIQPLKFFKFFTPLSEESSFVNAIIIVLCAGGQWYGHKKSHLLCKRWLVENFRKKFISLKAFSLLQCSALSAIL
jgi:hypothetical protein